MQQSLTSISLTFFFLFSLTATISAQYQPNIMILIADDLGRDAFPRYEIGDDAPNTPFLDSLSREGLLFMNAYANPLCAPSRAALLTGRYGNKNGITSLGVNMAASEITIFEQLDELTDGSYANALFGKWHLGGPNNPNNQGVQHYNGNFRGAISDYFKWERTINGVRDSITDYITSYITDEAIGWIDEQNKPWLLWMAYNAPHSPFHVPPDGLYTRSDTTSNLDKYLCMVESLDHETARLYHSLTIQEKENTLVLFVGDNGTPNNILQGFPNQHGKGSLYEGGINVPMFASGYGVERINEKENALVSFSDVFATITELVGTDLPGGIDNSLSFLSLLSNANSLSRTYNYSELSDTLIDRAIRNATYKLITRADGVQEFYDLNIDSFELNDLVLSGLSTDEILVLNELQMESDSIYYSWSCNDDIQNGNEEGVDCGGSSCSPCLTSLEKSPIEGQILVFPNPVNDELNVELAFGDYSIRILTPSAKVQAHFRFEGKNLKIDLGSLPQAVYFMEITNQSNKEVWTRKIVKH